MPDRISLSGVPETMLQTLYARAEESRTRGAIHDEAAEALVSKLDYDFSIAKRDKAMRSGVIARTIVLDKLTKAFLASHPGAVVVNIACGLDTRCYRMTGFSHWYNLDLPETMAVREKLLPEKNETISQLAMSAMDDWGAKSPKQTRLRSSSLKALPCIWRRQTYSKSSASFRAASKTRLSLSRR